MKFSLLTENTSLLKVYDDGYLRVEHDCYIVTCNNQYVKLPRAQFFIFSRLVKTPESVVSSPELWEGVWGKRKSFNPLSLHVYLYRLRRQLRPYEITIETLVNVGYRFIPPRKLLQSRAFATTD